MAAVSVKRSIPVALCVCLCLCVCWGGGGMELHDTYKKQMVILRGIIYNCLAYQRVLLNRVTQ